MPATNEQMRETGTLAERGYRDAARVIMAIDRVMPPPVLQELRQDGVQVQDVADQCARMVHAAWQREQPSDDPSRAARQSVSSGSR